jgi:hypothetical protein
MHLQQQQELLLRTPHQYPETPLQSIFNFDHAIAKISCVDERCRRRTII